MALPKIQAAIVNYLRKYNKIAEPHADKILGMEKELSGDAFYNLLKTEYKVNENHLLIARAQAFGYNPFSGKGFVLKEDAFSKLDKEFCRSQKVLPIGESAGFFLVALPLTFDTRVVDKISEEVKMPVAIQLGMEKDITIHLIEDEQEGEIDFNAIVEALGPEASELGMHGDETEESGPIIRLVNYIIETAYHTGGSDIHIEPMEKKCRVRVRVDGKCEEKLSLPAKISGALIARIKVMSNLDISEKRLPQDGRIVFSQFTKKAINIDLRVSTAPLNHGEGAVMRILDKSKSTLPLPALGYEPENLSLYRELILRPYGMVLHCGPTGSGKSMTLYSALNEINNPNVCIRTAEDPIEYTLDGLCQMQMKRQIGLTFSAALRAFLRQDPDIILVGEIRDSETAEIAVEAALTGHMLFSTLHTNDAPGTIARFTEMGIEPFMISASLVCVCAQRLLRRLCKNCREEVELTDREAEIMKKAIGWVGKVYRPGASGCPNCGQKGYKGRCGVHELMPTSEALVKGINDGLETAHLKRIAMMNGMSTLHQDSMKKVRDGVTSMQEAVAVVPPDLEDLEAMAEEFELEEALKRKKEVQRKAEIEAMKASASKDAASEASDTPAQEAQPQGS